MFIHDPRGRLGQFIRIISTETAGGDMLRLTTDTGRQLVMTPEKLATEIEAAKVPRNYRAPRK